MTGRPLLCSRFERVFFTDPKPTSCLRHCDAGSIHSPLWTNGTAPLVAPTLVFDVRVGFSDERLSESGPVQPWSRLPYTSSTTYLGSDFSPFRRPREISIAVTADYTSKTYLPRFSTITSGKMSKTTVICRSKCTKNNHSARTALHTSRARVPLVARMPRFP